MRILRLILTVLLTPVFLLIRLMILVCTVLMAISSGLLSILSSLLGMMAVLVIMTGSRQSGLMLIAIAWLLSPIGLPWIAEKLLYLLSDLCDVLQARLCI